MKTIFSLLIISGIMTACSSSQNNNASRQLTLEGTHWKLIELSGQPVTAEDVSREAYIQLIAESGRVTGNGGCNVMSGTYEVSSPNRIKFSQMATTKMACLKMDVEDRFHKALETTDSYYLKGDTLQLIRARMAPLAIFIAVESK
ncbi:MAG: META domain-containing protein [Ferruginibacter sp.]|nr:META domain-containing protein [Ferruginibacter sp.]